MTDFIIKKLPYDLSSNAGLALVGKYLKRININALVDPKFPIRGGVANSDILNCYLALLCLGKNDFDAVEAFAAMSLHGVRWVLVARLRALHCVNALMPVPVTGLILLRPSTTLC